MKSINHTLAIVFTALFMVIIHLQATNAKGENNVLPPSVANNTAEFDTSNIIYTQSDSIRIEQMLADGLALPPSTNLMLYFGKQFLGVPYVGHTLEVPYNSGQADAEENLVINLTELDCTTFVETVLTLTRTVKMGQCSFADYCRNLTTFRYQQGVINGYTSRNHYFTTWIDNALDFGLIHLVGPAESSLFKSRTQKIDFMTNHHDAYAALRNPGGERYFEDISKAEKVISREVFYLPTSALTMSKEQLPFVKDGDILALETLKAGLDVSHLGIAVWGKDGKLHLLNASSIHKKVLIDPKTLYDYQLGQKQQIGIRILRLKD